MSEYDQDLYSDKRGFNASIAAGDEEEDDELLSMEVEAVRPGLKLPSYTGHKEYIPVDKDADDVFKDTRAKTVAERESDYQARGRIRHRELSPARADMYGDKTPAHDLRKPSDALLDTKLDKEEEELRRKLEIKKKRTGEN
jgi:hypothetical protein